MSLADVTSARSSPAPEACPECDTSASVTSDLHKYQVACTCKPASVQYACADDPGPPPPAKTDTPPALPPRPPTSVLAATNRRNNASVGCNNETTCHRRKYAWWCVGCGALAAALGGLLAAQHIVLRAYTASPQHLETVPAAVPAAMLVLTGVCIMSLARRRNRYSYMIKVVGVCCLACALTCVLVTITTTVIHMNKLQTLQVCEYTTLTRTCTCFSVKPGSHVPDEDSVRCVFEGVSDCGVVHGALYWCLRGVFALSVSAVLVCIFSCMLAYQLLSHERKKMYWEQLELRCRSLYRAPGPGPGPHQHPHPHQPQPARHPQSNCSCCAQCHPSQPAWDISLQHRFWAPGRIGNLYSPNPGAGAAGGGGGRKTSAWSWFPWPRSNTHNSRCRMGVPQSGDSAYGFCDDAPLPQNYDDRYPTTFPQPFQRANSGNFTQSAPGPAQSAPFTQSYNQEFGEGSGSFDAQTGVWGPPPPYSPQGRNGSRHHLHQDPAAATLLHHHHIDIHRIDPPPLHDHTIQQHTCRNSYLMSQNADMSRINDMTRMNPDMTRMNSDMTRMNPDMTRMNPDMTRINPDMTRMNPDMTRINPDMSRINDLSRDIAMSQMYPQDVNELEMSRLPQETRFNTLRGHLVPYRCQRLGMSANNLHSCRMDENVAIECLSGSKVSDQSSDSCQKQGKENLGFQNDKHSPLRSSMQECHRAGAGSAGSTGGSAGGGGAQNAESEVYFADVSSCCNVSLKAECCMNANVSALVGTIENHPESTSESDTGSFTLTRQQRPQPQVGSKRRPRQTDKHKNQDKIRALNGSLRLTEHQIEHLNNSMRMCERMTDRDRLNDPRIERMNEVRMSERMNESRIERMNDARVSDRMSERIDSRDRLNERIDSRSDRNDSRDRLNEGLNDSRISERMNETRLSERMERMNDSRVSDRMNDSRISDRVNDSRITDRVNDPRVGERINDSRIIDRVNDSRIIDRVNDSRISDRVNDSRISDRANDSRISDRMNDSRISDRMNDSRIIDRVNDSRIVDRVNDSRIGDRMNDSRISDRANDSRISDRMNDSRISDRERIPDLNSSIRIEGSPKLRTHISPLRMPRTSPKNLPKEHLRQSSTDSNKPEFFMPPPPIISPLSPNTEESLLSDDDRPDQVYSNDPETSKCLGPDSQYEPVREEKEEVLKLNHHHCYSDTNTMDSGWQSGSEKQVTD